VYIDDIQIFSKTAEEHVVHLRQALDRLKTNQYHAKLSKCEFERSKVKFLGHIVGADGVKVDPAKIAAINNWKKPENVSEVRSFVGLATYFRKFVEHFHKSVLL
jgi:hypothetical protein